MQLKPNDEKKGKEENHLRRLTGETQVPTTSVTRNPSQNVSKGR